MKYARFVIIGLMIACINVSAKEWLYSWSDVDGDEIDEKFIYVVGENGEINAPYVYAPWVTVIAWQTARTALSVMKLRQILYWGEDLILDTGSMPEVPNGSPWYYVDTYYDTMYTYMDGDKTITIWQAPKAKLKRVADLTDDRAFLRFYLWYHEGDCWKYLGKTGLLMTWNDGKTTIEGAKQFVLDRLSGLKSSYIDSFPSPEPGEFTFKIEYSYDDYADQIDDYSVLAWDGGSASYPDTRAIFGTLLLPKPDYLFTEYSSAPCSEFTHADWSFKGELLAAGIRIRPRTINLKSQGVFTAAIHLPEGYDPSHIDLYSIECEGAMAFDGNAAANQFIAKFRVKDLEGVEVGIQEFTVTGKLESGEPFSGSDFVKVTDQGIVVMNVIPNPVHDKATISYQLSPSVENVELRIFSVAGELVRTMNVSNTASILTKISWDRTDDQGRMVSNGIYLIQLKGGQAVRTEKVVVTK